jgi:leader peptidase (prepilin peptidase)/N-methyltransferase
MLVAVWTFLVLFLLFLLGSAVGSFLNVCIVRLPQGRSLIRPASCCGHCHTPIRSRDNIPLLSYWLLHGRCRACGTPFSMRYFWIELLTGVLFVLIYHFEIARNIHHFEVWSWYENDYEYVLMRMFDAQRWLVFSAHALLGCFLIVATMCLWERQRVPASVTLFGVFVGLSASLLFPWPWPDAPSRAVVDPAGNAFAFGSARKAYPWGPRMGAMPNASPWWLGDVTPHQGLYPWPVWGPPPSWLPAGSRALGLATGLAGILAGAVLIGSARLLFNAAVGARALGWGETNLMMVAGAFLGWQPIVVAALLGSVPGLLTAARQAAKGRQASFAWWLTAAVVAVWFGWFWMGPLVQGLFFNASRLLLFAAGYTVSLLVFSFCLRRVAFARRSGFTSA